MIQRIVLGLALLAAVAVAVMAVTMRRRGGDLPTEAVQWPFDEDDLQTLMDRVVDDQRERIGAIEDADGRQRAQAFLEYYEERLSAAIP